MSLKVKVTLTKEIKEGSTVLEGFPGIGLVGGIATSYLIEKLKMEPIGYIESELLAPVAFFKNGLAEHAVRIYAKDNIVVLHSDVAILPSVMFDLSKALVSVFDSAKVDRVFSLTGVTMPMEEKYKIYGVANSKEFLEELKKYNIEVLEEGAISGISGLLLLDCATRGIKAAALLVPTIGLRPDPRAAAEIIKTLNTILNIDVDVEPLLEEAKAIEAKMEEIAQQLRKARQQMEVRELPYVG